MLYAVVKKNALLLFSLTVLIAAFILQYYVDIRQMVGRWDSEDFSYCYLVPLIFVYLVYTNRHQLKKDEFRSSLYGFIVIIFSGILYLTGKLGSIETLNAISIWITITGVSLLLLGPGLVGALAFPFLILAFIIPLPPFLNNLFTFRLKLISSALSVKMMRLADISVFREGNIIDLGITQLQVVDACSGLRYVYPLFLMGLIFAYLLHRKWWERIAIILAAIPISVLSNALRIAITGYLTIYVSPQAAEGFFHGFSGWLIFMVSFVFLAILSWILRFIRNRFPHEVPVRNDNPGTGVYFLDLGKLKTSYVWIASVLFLGFWGLNTVLASSQIVPDRKSFNTFPISLEDWEGKKAYLSQDILDSLWADDYVQIYFNNEKTNNYLLLFVPYYEFQKSRHTAHAPAACLLGSGYALRSRNFVEKTFPPPFGKVRIGQMVLEKDRQLVLSNYWFQGRGRIIASEYINKWRLFQDAVIRQRTDGALVRIEMPLNEGQTIEEAQNILDAFITDLMGILPEYVPI